MCLSAIDPPNSSAAIRAASTEPRPPAVDSGPFMSAITPILIVSFEICALLDDTFVMAKVKAPHRLAVRPSFLMEVLLEPSQTTGRRVRVLEADPRVISKRGCDTPQVQAVERQSVRFSNSIALGAEGQIISNGGPQI